ncbi:hypothetical protein [Candidatus Chlamydia corallus]|uniref:hypothetical protein n=1 Tax=Candidatus Chlamydia corallus TaxID=2038470 RepID=UPI001865A136|nr:hypothetical protein [Candidatus Chlamydia corallus]
MNKLKQKETIVESSTPLLNPNENSGVKDQNLFMDQGTLSVEGNATIENTLITRDLKVSDTITSPSEFIVGGNLLAESSQFNATTLSKGMNIYSQTSSSATPRCNNIRDPESPRDALTFNYYKKTGCEATNMYIYYANGYQVNQGQSIETNAWATGKDMAFNSTPNASLCVDINPIIKFKKEGIYQVTIQLTRWSGYHGGPNTAGLFLNFISGSNKVLLCTSDTRGTSGGDYVSVALTATFAVTEIIPSPPHSYPWIDITSYDWINIMSLSTCVIWFPFSFNFSEVD